MTLITSDHLNINSLASNSGRIATRNRKASGLPIYYSGPSHPTKIIEEQPNCSRRLVTIDDSGRGQSSHDILPTNLK